MTIVSNDDFFLPIIYSSRISSYFTVACSIVVVYDWVLTFGQEFELVWRQRWSLMTIIYLSVRYIGIIFSVVDMLGSVQSVSLTDAGCLDNYLMLNYMDVIVPALLGVIIIAQLHAMYQRSRKMLVFLIVIFLVTQIAIGAITSILVGAVQGSRMLDEELVLSGAHLCSYDLEGRAVPETTWVLLLGTTWQILVLCLAVRVAVKHFRELQAASIGWTVSDCFTILIKTHVFYFISFAFQLSYLLPQFLKLPPAGAQILGGVFQIAHIVQMFILGPRLILGIREYHAKLVANCDDGSNMTSIAFQERVHISTGGSV